MALAPVDPPSFASSDSRKGKRQQGNRNNVRKHGREEQASVAQGLDNLPDGQIQAEVEHGDEHEEGDDHAQRLGQEFTDAYDPARGGRCRLAGTPQAKALQEAAAGLFRQTALSMKPGRKNL